MPKTRVALVTGAGTGIGRAIAFRLAQDGFNVAISDQLCNEPGLTTLVAEIRELGRKVVAVTADVSVEVEIQGMIQRTVEELGQLDVMVANAGVMRFKPFLETTSDDWQKIFAVNGLGTFLCYQYAAKQMIAQGHGGKIIGACSGSGKQAEPMMSAYSSSKFAIRGLTQATAVELGQYGIQVNAYAPGAIETPMIREIGEIVGDWEALKAQEVRKAPVGRFGVPEDISNLVSFLASDQSEFITGQTIPINGGRLCD